MSSLTTTDKRYLENILSMGGGYVLDFTDTSFRKFFNSYNVDIHDLKYQTDGTSKAKKLRAFWEKEPDALVGNILSELLDIYETTCELNQSEVDANSLAKSREIIAKLSGEYHDNNSMTVERFLKKEFEIPNIQNLPVEFAVSEIIRDRLKEAQSCLCADAPLAAIFQCGSVLEGVLLGAAQKEPETFNRSPASPKRDGKVKGFREWTLSEFIDVAHDIGLLDPDVQKFSHGLRDFRNYIHPYEQMASGFKPDEHTAWVCFHVLKAALANVSGGR